LCLDNCSPVLENSGVRLSGGDLHDTLVVERIVPGLLGWLMSWHGPMTGVAARLVGIYPKVGLPLLKVSSNQAKGINVPYTQARLTTTGHVSSGNVVIV